MRGPAPRAWLNIFTPRSNSPCSTIRGGRSRMTFPWVQLTSSPRSRQAVTTGPPSCDNCRPHISPTPRIASMTGKRLCSNCFFPGGSAFCTAARKCGSHKMPREALAAVAITGPPPKVLAWVPENPGRRLGGQKRPHGQPPGQGFGQGHDVRGYSRVLVGEEAAGPPQAALDLVKDQQNARSSHNCRTAARYSAAARLTRLLPARALK